MPLIYTTVCSSNIQITKIETTRTARNIHLPMMWQCNKNEIVNWARRKSTCVIYTLNSKKKKIHLLHTRHNLHTIRYTNNFQSFQILRFFFLDLPLFVLPFYHILRLHNAHPHIYRKYFCFPFWYFLLLDHYK